MLYSLVALLILTEPPAQPVKLEASKTVTVRIGEKCVLVAATNAKKVTWFYPPGVDALPLDGKRLAVWATEGTYQIEATVPAGDDVLKTIILLTVTGPRPPPIPPGPTPTPVPPVPPAPIAAEGLHVLIIYQDKFPLSKEQHAAIYGKEIRDYLNAKCPKEPSGNAGWRIWDAELDVSLAPKYFQDAFNRAKARPDLSLPWLIVSDGKTGWEGPLPADALTVIKRFGGE